MRHHWLLVAILALCASRGFAEEIESTDGSGFYTVEGELVVPPETLHDQDWHVPIRVLLNGGEHVGFVRSDGSFKIRAVPPGSYAILVENSRHHFEPARVDITSKGKMRARRLNNLQPSAVTQLAYPLRLAAVAPIQWFRQREEWRITDVLMSPMVLLMVAPLLIMLVLPKLTANDPEMRKELEQMQMPEMPSFSDMMTNFLGGGEGQQGANKKQKRSAGVGTSGGAGSSGGTAAIKRK